MGAERLSARETGERHDQRRASGREQRPRALGAAEARVVPTDRPVDLTDSERRDATDREQQPERQPRSDPPPDGDGRGRHDGEEHDDEQRRPELARQLLSSGIPARDSRP